MWWICDILLEILGEGIGELLKAFFGAIVSEFFQPLYEERPKRYVTLGRYLNASGGPQ